MINIKSFKNLYCDAVYCALGQFMDCDELDLNLLTRQQIQTLCDYSVVKNKKAGVSFLNLKVPYPCMGIEALEKFGMKGNEIISASLFESIPTRALVGQKLILNVESLMDYNDNFLSEIADFSAKTDIPIIFSLGGELEEVGKIVNRFGLSPGKTLESFGFLDRSCYIYGGNFIDKDDQNLLKDYGASFILSPRSDGENGLGAINLYNFIYNDLKFCFSSGKCYNIDMLGECKLAMVNTSNLMYEKNLLSLNDLLNAVSDNEELSLDFDESEREENLLDKKVDIEVKEYEKLREQVKLIVKELKEKK